MDAGRRYSVEGMVSKQEERFVWEFALGDRHVGLIG
jgi:hypothetical protein